ncbi:hypothetical protein ASPZODRAFT_1548493 [Penicilliopsis zonata CBS 506.65]|uniref:Uncharacterized protein n=1 Tax=Penicilliopsis zonata CBS 506.65 TaxID=1073090 RepID=A0A1L9SMI3_9EURO|nr:hypothetical protein ASPZODRAFT_1548493 [Penicilliopsis zonata CBS 506.65]OJJ48264.1 hypothetical protein ASPZODRAFT_1548493 [Penicilliopsis zonata CBS 506.65]
MLVRPLSDSAGLRSTSRLLGLGVVVRRLRRRSGRVNSGEASRWAASSGWESLSCERQGCRHGAATAGVRRGTWLTGFHRRTAAVGGERGREAAEAEGEAEDRARVSVGFDGRRERETVSRAVVVVVVVVDERRGEKREEEEEEEERQSEGESEAEAGCGWGRRLAGWKGARQGSCNNT